VSILLPADVRQRIRALDTEITPEMVQGTWALLTPYHEKLGYLAPSVVRDLRYGPSERNRLDVHSASPQPASSPARVSTGPAPGLAPVLLFVHGGGFVRGDKHVPGSPVYDFVGAWAVRHGAVGVTMTYRLAPAHVWPAGAQDVAAAVRWTRENIAAYGGDPDRIVVAGHSAGAVHVASFLAGHGRGQAMSAGQDGWLDGVAGGALLSGVYDLDPAYRGEADHVYFGGRSAEEASTLPHLAESAVPLLFSVAELDPAHFHRQAARVVSEWHARQGRMPAMAWVEGHNHISEIGSLGIDEGALGTQLARFLERVAS
jgi:triacylglycerol lipase